MPPITPPMIAPTGVPVPVSDVLVVEAVVVPGVLVVSRRLVVVVLVSKVDCFEETDFVGVTV